MEKKNKLREAVIIGFSNPNTEGVTLHLNKPTSLNGGIRSNEWYVSWDKIGKLLFKDYTDIVNVAELNKLRYKYFSESEDLRIYQESVRVEELNKIFEKWYCDYEMTHSIPPKFNQITEWFAVQNKKETVILDFSESTLSYQQEDSIDLDVLKNKIQHEIWEWYKGSKYNDVFDLIDKAILPHLNQKAEQNDAVDFAEWVGGMFNTTNIKGVWRVPKSIKTYTTEELYKQFLKTK